MYQHILSVAAGALLLSGSVSAKQPYNNWNDAYKQADKLMSSWSIENQANVSVRSGTAPGYLPFTVSDGTCCCVLLSGQESTFRLVTQARADNHL